jgi:hypothetical protein
MNQCIIYTNAEGGVSVFHPSPDCPLTIGEMAAQVVPASTPYEIVPVADIPADRTFRNAWEKQGRAIGHNIAKCKDIAHEKRRAAREVEFEPHDAVIAKQIPGKDAQAAEAAREAIRQKYAVIQSEIDAATDVAALKAIVERL